jgi:hypothetical protein
MAGSEESACKSACRSASYRQPGKQKPRLSGAFEEGLLARDQRLLNPLDPIEGGFWDVIKLDPPAALFEEADTLARIRDVSRRTDQTR